MIIENEAAYNAAIKRNIITNAQKTWRSSTDRANEIEVALEAGRRFSDYGAIIGYSEDFIGSLAEAFDTYGKLSPAQCAAVLKGIDTRAQRRAEWNDQRAALDARRQHLGEIGQKITLKLTVRKIIEFETVFGWNSRFIMEDSEQNVVIYKGNSAAFAEVNEGETIAITATVKDHGTRDGTKQTVIQRPKINSK